MDKDWFKEKVKNEEGSNVAADGIIAGSIVTPENTKLIAEWMGLIDQYCYGSIENNKFILCDVIGELGDKECCEYNLIDNADQSRKVEKKLIFEYGYTIHGRNINCASLLDAANNMTNAKTLELAIYRAALLEASK